MPNRTPFYEEHVANGAKIVDFAGWEMPLHYGSQLDEHHQVRQAVGMFDISHMGIVDLSGPQVEPYLKLLLANNVDRLVPGKALYTCMLNDKGGVIDDLIVYQCQDNTYRLVINAGRRQADLAWMRQKVGSFNLAIKERTDLVMLALQGPLAEKKMHIILSAEDREKLHVLKPFHYMEDETKTYFIARTGYTGEDGFEIIFPAFKAKEVWRKFLQANVKPIGLGARDTLRLEAGLNLYGSDMDETVSPLEANLKWTVMLEPKERMFVGRQALEQQLTAGVKRELVGLVLEGPGVMRNHQTVLFATNADNEAMTGEITSGGYSPTIGKSIALARIPVIAHADHCFVEIRQKRVQAKIVKPPFVRHGQKMI